MGRERGGQERERESERREIGCRRSERGEKERLNVGNESRG